MEPRSGLPTVWTTHLAKALVGENACLLQPWLTARFKFDRRGDETALVQWKANHTTLLTDIVAQYRKDGFKCQVERFFKAPGRFVNLTGKADLIAQKTDVRPLIIDAKSGSPKDSDVAQVMVEMLAVPLAWQAPAMVFDGLVIYPTHQVKVTPAEANGLRSKAFGLLKQLGTMARPAPSPSRDNCLWCVVPKSECPDRWSEVELPEVVNEEF